MTEKRGSTKGSTKVRRSTTGVRQKGQFVEPFTNPFTNHLLSTKYNKKEGVRHKKHNVTKKAEKQAKNTAGVAARTRRAREEARQVPFQITPYISVNAIWCIYYSNKARSGRKETDSMNFIEDNWAYIKETAEARAVEIAVKTRSFQDVPDYMQDMFLFLSKRAAKYDPARSQPKTFINIVLRSAKINIQKRIFRHKNLIITNADKGPRQYD